MKFAEVNDTDVTSAVTNVSKAMNDAVAGIEQRLGLTGNALTTVSEQFLKFAEVNDTDVTSAVTNVSKAMNDAGISGTQASQVLDQLTAASQASGIGVDRLTELLSLNGVTMRQTSWTNRKCFNNCFRTVLEVCRSQRYGRNLCGHQRFQGDERCWNQRNQGFPGSGSADCSESGLGHWSGSAD